MAGEERVTKLKIDNVKKIYQTRKGEMTALNGVNLDIKENEYEELEKFLTDITYDIDIRTQEKIFEKAESLHRLLSTEEKMDEALMLFEILVLSILKRLRISAISFSVMLISSFIF